MAYRRIDIIGLDGKPETLWCRVSEEVFLSWLGERAYLKAHGYPDRPPDVDTATIRAWLPHQGEESLSYFRAGSGGDAPSTGVFSVYTASWHAPPSHGAKVIITGLPDGALLSRVIIEGPDDGDRIDKAHQYPATTAPEVVWGEVETIITFINEARMGWDEPLVTDYPDFEALDVALAVARTEARAAGITAKRGVDS